MTNRFLPKKKKQANHHIKCAFFSYKFLFSLSCIQKMGLFSKKSPQPSYASAPPAYSTSPAPSNQYAPPSPPKQPVNPDRRQLPSGWISQYDSSSGKFFYVYTPTALRQWEHPADKPLHGNRGENNSYGQQQQQPYYGQQQQQRYYQQQPQYMQQPQYVQQPQYIQQPQGSKGSGMGWGKVAAAGLGGALLGNFIGNEIFDDRPEIIENNYYDSGPGGFEGGYDGGFDGGFDDF